MADIVGTPSGDVIDVSAQAGSFRIDALGGDDRVTGAGGDDTIVLGQGNDTLAGGGGNDTFIAQATDWGDKRLSGGAGVDVILGGAGDDTIRLVSFDATNSIETIDGGAGTNVLSGTSSDNVLDFGATQLVNIARIDAGAGNDRVTGSAGDDTIVIGQGYDTLAGGGGNDTFLAQASDWGEKRISGGAGVDVILGGAGDDTIRFVSFDATNSIEKIDGGAGINVVAGTGSGNVLDLSATQLVNIARIDAGAGDDRVTGTAGDEVIVGGAGYDTLIGGGGIDTAVYSGAFANYRVVVSGNRATVTSLAGTDGEDTLVDIAYLQFSDQTVRIAAAPPPVAAADTATTNEDGAVAIDVLANDSSAGGGALAVTQVTQGAHGAVAILADGRVGYTPAANFFGSDSFTYTVSNGSGLATASVQVTVAPAADPPLAVDDAAAVAAGGTVAIDVLANDSDPDGDALSVASFAQGQHGAVGLEPDGTLRYTPEAGFVGQDSFTYMAGDGSALAAATVTVTVQPVPPQAIADAATTDEDSAVVIDVLANDTSPGGGALAVTQVTQGAHGAVAILPDGTLRYTPEADYFGSDSFTYTVGDGQGSASATVALSVAAIPDAPRPVDDAASVQAGAAISLDVLANDRDPDGETLAIQSFGQAQHGTVSLNPDGTLAYAAAAGYSGADSFAYTVTDPTGRTTAANVTITVEGGPLSFEQMLVSAPSNSWVRLNLNEFQDVWAPTELQPLGGPSVGGYSSPDRVIGAWSSMAWDSNRDQLIFWGGGHANYPGNEIYLWQSATRSWTRGSLPSEIVNLGGARYEAIDGVDNAPIAAHTYDNDEFLPIIDRFVVVGGSTYTTGNTFTRDDGAGGLRHTGPYLWDPSRADPNKVGGTGGSSHDPTIAGANMWQNRDTLYSMTAGALYPGSRSGEFINGVSAYAQENGKDVLYISDGNLWKYTFNDVADPTQDTYEMVGRYWESFSGQGAGAIDPEHHVFVRTYEGGFTYWDLSQPGGLNFNVRFTPTDLSGGFSVGDLYYFGMDYDSARNEFVLWDGGPDIWTLAEPETIGRDGWTLTKHAAPSGSALPSRDDGASPNNAFHGVLGKWKYASDLDVFLGAIDPVQGTVWAYKPDNWQPPQLVT